MVPGGGPMGYVRSLPGGAVAKVGIDAKVSLSNLFGNTHVIADVVGWVLRVNDACP